jgi:uncharacterized NAD(P)/FAD-binding protein YdhS
MNPQKNLAIIGSGPSSIYLLKHLLTEARFLKDHLQGISIFEKSGLTGTGMPYSPQTTDRYNMANISSEELPELMVSFADWLRKQDRSILEEIDLADVEIDEHTVYNRLALGRYLNSQYQAIVSELSEIGIPFQEYAGCEIVDLHQEPGSVKVRSAEGEQWEFSKVIIATGHYWTEEDQPEKGYYASPWPISKLIPKDGEFHDFTIGTLGASLSAFDVVSSLAHRHGTFRGDPDQRLVFHPHPGAENFKIVMHSAQGLLPHLQFEQVEPLREIYRHVDRDSLLDLLDENGFLRIETYFDKVCRPALSDAFAKDKMPEMVELLTDPKFGIREFSEKMTDEHDYQNAFEGMRHEMVEAKDSVLNRKPIHWKEVLDDLMYTLNFHAELMPAEDHLLFHSHFMPFLMNVIAAMPLPSGNTLLALYDAGKLELVSGNVTLGEDAEEKDMTAIEVEDDGEKSTVSYRMFVDCSGQKPLELKEYPFPSLVESGAVRKARAPFSKSENAKKIPDEKKEHLFQVEGELFYQTGGIDVDGTYRVIGADGNPNSRIHDIAFPHISGVRPYSYGLQACADTSAILVRAWIDEIKTGSTGIVDPEGLTEIYDEL